MKEQHPSPANHDLGEASSKVIEQAQHEVVRSRVPWFRTSRRAKVFIGIYFLEFVLFSLLAWFVHIHPVLGIDVTITKEFQENPAPWLQTLTAAVNYLGFHALLFSALILGTAILFWIVRLHREAILIVGLSLVSAVLNLAIKVLVNRPRPTSNLVEVLQHLSDQSFPSGHVMSYVAFWGLLFSLGIILLKRDRWWHYLLLILPALFVLLVGPARIYVGEHWASDVLGAYLIGSLLLGLTLWIYLTLKARMGMQKRK